MALHAGSVYMKTKLVKQATTILLRCQSTATMSDNSSSQAQSKAKPLSAMPSPPAWPLLGHLPLMMKKETQDKIHTTFDKFRDQFGDMVRLYIPGQGHLVLVFTPEDTKTLYASDGKIPNIPGFDIFELMRKTTMKDRYTTAGLISNTQDWYEVRHTVQQDMMRPKSALYYLPEMEDIAIELADKIQEKKNKNGMLNPSTLLQQFALEAVGCVFMGARLGALQGVGDGKTIIEKQEQGAAILLKLFFMPLSIAPYLPMYKTYIGFQTEMFDISKKHVDAAIANIKDTDDTVIAKLVRKCGKDSQIPLIMGIDALQAGIETTGTTAIFLLYHLASNPDKQELLYQEICKVIGPHGEMTESELAKMKYLKACQTESQRIMPAIFGTSRRTDSDIVIGGYKIPKGTTVIRCGSSSQNDPANFKNPDKFLPERWLRGCPDRHNADPFANIPWGHGARSCIGQRFAKLELYMMMVKVVQRFSMEYAGEDIGVRTQFISVPDKPVNIKFIER